ncbi:type II/IV secretion system protein [Candidatus Roizmanbacteria bacterium]|nr:type II/IV secretion system protein [Candidatus Roizmanbacteria bacterium]
MQQFDEKLYQILQESAYIKKDALDGAYTSAQELKKPLSDVLVFRGLISENMLGQLIADSLKLPYIALRSRTVTDEVLTLVPENLARRYKIIPIGVTDTEISIAMEDPDNFEAIEAIRRRTGRNVKPAYATKGDIARALNQYKRNFKEKFEQIILENAKKASELKEQTIEKLLKMAQDLPVVKIFDALLEYAVGENASDVHIETSSDNLLIRLRVDGILLDTLNLPKSIQPAIVARIKVLSNLKIDEHRVPQDGRFRFQIDENLVALRVSIIPGFYGENVVLRLLPETARPLSFEELGIMGQNLKYVKENLQRTFGMILVTGPTGSGKTTTLYSALNILNTPKINICTVEDPIEYGIARVNQIQVNTKTKLTFAAGLRALLRHDPDIIMVGEIRDEETVSIAIHAALTGHLVLSTIHTNNAVGTIARFLDMGAKEYLLASTLNLVIAQRLVRKICQNCIAEYTPAEDMLERMRPLLKETGNIKRRVKYFRGKGCDECHGSGFRGRVGIYEILNVDEEIRELIAQKAAASQIRQMADTKGMKTMFQDGLDKIQAGLTTIDEMLGAVTQ